MDGHIAEVHFLDGYVYDASYFGTRKNGVWIPKDYKTDAGNYGTKWFLPTIFTNRITKLKWYRCRYFPGNNNHHDLNNRCRPYFIGHTCSSRELDMTKNANFPVFTQLDTVKVLVVMKVQVHKVVEQQLQVMVLLDLIHHDHTLNWR